MRYVVLICGDEHLDLSAEESRVIVEGAQAWVAEMTARGVRLTGHRLAVTDTATTVRVQGGEVLVSDGLFAETKEQIGGFDLIECADLDEALEVAAKHRERPPVGCSVRLRGYDAPRQGPGRPLASLRER